LIGENGAASRIFVSCFTTGLSPGGGQMPSAAAFLRMAMRSSRLLYAQMCTHWLRLPTSTVPLTLFPTPRQQEKKAQNQKDSSLIRLVFRLKTCVSVDSHPPTVYWWSPPTVPTADSLSGPRPNLYEKQSSRCRRPVVENVGTQSTESPCPASITPT
jgi:hypothetical protein